MLLEIKNLYKKYDKRANYAIEDINIQGDAGEIIGILGHNGAGKSTTIKCITGMHPYEEGTISICEHDLRFDPIRAKSCFGYVSDEFTLFEKMTGYEFINFMADIYKVKKKVRRERVRKFQKLFALGDAIYNPISSYSHGMKQKLAIISAWLHSPKLVIMDEPFVGLDPKASFALKEMMREHCNNGGSIFFSTHVLDVAEKLCDKVAIIKDGKLVVSGNMKEVLGDESLESVFLELEESREDD